jgi:predicted RNase H-like HicB family nuclease
MPVLGYAREKFPPAASEFTAIIEHDGNWYIAYCAEIAGANGQGRIKKKARESLAKAIKLVLADRLARRP